MTMPDQLPGQVTFFVGTSEGARDEAKREFSPLWTWRNGAK